MQTETQKLLPGEARRPLPLGSAVKAYLKGAVQTGIIIGSAGNGPRETRYKVRFRPGVCEWLPLLDVVAVQVGESYVWRGK